MHGMRASQQRLNQEEIVWKTEIRKLEETMRERETKIEDIRGRKRHSEETGGDQIVVGDHPVEGDLVAEGGLEAEEDLTAEGDPVAEEDMKITEDKIATEDRREITTRSQRIHMREVVKEEARGGQ